MRWVVLFGGIGVFAAVLYALLGVWLWRRAKGLLAEVRRSERRVQLALVGVETDDAGARTSADARRTAP